MTNVYSDSINMRDNEGGNQRLLCTIQSHFPLQCLSYVYAVTNHIRLVQTVSLLCAGCMKNGSHISINLIYQFIPPTTVAKLF